jgi:iron complex outermembrane receptor protein
LSTASAWSQSTERESVQTLRVIKATDSDSGTIEVRTQSGALGEKSILDTPFSITVVEADDIYKRQATTVGQIFVLDPSVFSSSVNGMTNWWGPQIRGLGVRNFYIDGVPMVLEWGGELPLEAVESVEALKGLTGFMYGFGLPGGVISYKTKRPTDETLMSTTLAYRTDSQLLAHLDLGGRLGSEQRLGYRINVSGETGDAYTGAGVNRNFASLALDFKPTDSLLWYVNVMQEDSKFTHEPLYFYWNAYEGGDLPEPTYDYRNLSIDNSYYKTETLLSSTGIKWAIADEWMLDVSAGHSRKEHISNKMFANILNRAGDYQGFVYNFAGLLQNYFSQALVQGSFATGPIKHELAFGAAYQRKTDRWASEFYFEPDFVGNLYQRQTFLTSRAADFTLLPVAYDERQRSLFASDTLRFGDHWQGIVGARFTDYEEIHGGYETDELTPTAAVIYKPWAHASIYASYVEALEAGGRVPEESNGLEYENRGEVLDATVSKQYEIGVKYGVERLTFTTAAFRVERAAQIDVLRGGLLYLVQDGLTLYQGLEAMGDYQVTENLSAGLGATYIDASLEDLAPELEANEGKTPAGAAKWQAVANLEYQIPDITGLSVHGVVRYYGDQYYEDANRVLIPDRTLANVGFQYETVVSGRNVSLTGSINNLFNEKYWELNTLGEGINGSLSLRVSW